MRQTAIIDRKAVVVPRPRDIAVQAFGTVSKACRTLKLKGNSFYNYERKGRMPLSVYRTIEALRPGSVAPVDSLTTEKVSYPYRITSPIVAKHVAAGTAESSVVSSDVSPTQVLRELLTRYDALERENAELKRKLATFRNLLD